MLVIGVYLSGEYDDRFSLERMRVSKLRPGFRRISILLATSAILVPVYYTHAQTSITGSQTTPVKTGGKDVTVGSGGTITITGGSAITINSNNTVDNEGTIAGNNGNNMDGIKVTTGATGTITNGGSITLTDSTPATTIPLTNATGRYGILIAGPTAFNGGINNLGTGSIAVRGNNSGGILIFTGGLNGPLEDGGTISITGNNSFGIDVNAPILGTGNGIAVTNTMTVLGTGSVGVLINNTVAGQLYVDDTIRSTGYYNNQVTTTRPATFTGLTANNMLQGGSAVSVNASIGEGISVDSLGDLVTYGSAPALLVAPASGTVTIGNVGADGADIIINGSVHANGIYDGVTASGIQVGGGAGLVNLAGSIDVTGKVQAISYAAAAAGITIGSGATVASIANFGTIQSMVNFGADGVTGGNATAILVGPGGALSAITNTGTITASSDKGTTNAMDLRGDTTFVTVTQSASGTATAPSITGNVLFGSNGGALILNAGTLAGSISFGSSANNALTLGGGVISGALTQAAGGQLALNLDGRLALTNASNLVLNSLTLGSQGQFDFAVNPVTEQTGSATVVGAIMIAKGARIGLTFDSQLTTAETFTLIQTAGSTGQLVGQPSLLLGDVPYFYDAKVITDASGGTVAVDIHDRPFADAGVLGSASAYNAIFKANYNDPGIRDAFNAAGTQQEFKRLFQQMLPSYSGGVFEVLAQGADTLARTEGGNPVMQNGANRGGGWAQQFGFGAVDSTSSSPGYHGGGLGFAFGWETPASAISTWGVSVAYMRAAADDFDTGPADEQVATTYTAGVYWREIDGGLHTDASINAGVAELNSNRFFSGSDLTGAAVMRTANASWTGGVAQAHLGISYEQPIGGDFFVKPSVAGDYFILYQGSRNEHNGGSAFDLNVASNTDKQGAVTGGVAVGMQFGDRDFTWRPELMVGYKQIFGGPDTVVAQFAGGSAFSLNPASQDSGPIAHVGVHGGNKYSDFAVEAGGEDRGDYRAFDGRVVARFQF
jgi:hypothetical protein